ncbi:glycosyltransferase family 4 protein [Natrarchaeobius sp. A-rgal3]|uniref:glycosyltransferase family 4 protein n=1 Tax=Natrarchaeobius versutus TaxID=1679078 RepID=UPI0035103F30
MRILRVAQKVYPQVKGGGAYHVHAMSRDQAAMGHDVTVLTIRRNPDQPHTEEQSGYTVIRYEPVVDVLGNEISPGLAQYLMDSGDFDVIHAHSHLYFSSNLAAARRRLNGDVPLLVTNHGIYSQNISRWIFEPYLRTIGAWTFNQADLVFCYSAGGKKRARSLGIKSEIEVVSNGIDPERFTPDGASFERISEGAFAVVSPIRLVEGKRPIDVVKATERLKEKHPQIELYICGDGPLREELERYIRSQGLDDFIHLLGMVSYDEMPAVYRSADLVVLPSEAEGGAPRVLLEAMAAETPYVTSNLTHLAAELKELGGATEVGDLKGFSDQIASFIDDDTYRSRAGKRGRDVVLDEYNWQKTVKETTATTERVIKST